jgi:hypothetical protein
MNVKPDKNFDWITGYVDVKQHFSLQTNALKYALPNHYGAVSFNAKHRKQHH